MGGNQVCGHWLECSGWTPSPLLGLAESSVQASSWAPGHREQIHLCFSGQEWLLPPRLSDCLLLAATTLDLLPQASCLYIGAHKLYRFTDAETGPQSHWLRADGPSVPQVPTWQLSAPGPSVVNACKYFS